MKINIIKQVDAIPLKDVLGEEFFNYYFYDGRVYSDYFRYSRPIGFKTRSGVDVVRFTTTHREMVTSTNYSFPHLVHQTTKRTQIKLSVIQQKVNDYTKGCVR